jgi:hypothetical protein
LRHAKIAIHFSSPLMRLVCAQQAFAQLGELNQARS